MIMRTSRDARPHHVATLIGLLVMAGTLSCARNTTDGGAAKADEKYRLPVWPRSAASPEFKLVDFDGRRRALSDYAGRVVVVFFGFGRCPDVCPTELYKVATAVKRLGAVGQRVQVLFVTLDPERDTPGVLKSYVTSFDPRFIGLTGTTAEIDAAAASFFVQHARVGTAAGYSIDHSSTIYLLDGSGHLRLVGALETSIDDLAHDIAALAAEQTPGR
jgi:protein SCO1/2